MSWVAAAAAGGAVIGSLIQSNAVRGASGEQARATEAAIAEQRRQFDLIRGDTAPWRHTGGAAVSRLGHLLGLPPAPPPSAAPPPGAGVPPPGTTPPPSPVPGYPPPGPPPGTPPGTPGAGGGYPWQTRKVDPPGTTPLPDDGKGPPGSEDDFGSLTRRFSARDLLGDPILQQSEIMQSLEGVDPNRLNAKFSEKDFWDDAVVKLGFEHGLGEGRTAIDRMAGAGGMRNSGATLKALTRFGQDYAGSKAEGAYDRFEGEKDDLMQRFGYADTMRLGSYDRFKGDQDSLYNRLAGVAGLGTTATGQSAGAGAQTGANIGNLLTSGANARGAAQIAQGNIWGGAINNIGQWWAMNNRPGSGGNGNVPFYGTGGAPY